MAEQSSGVLLGQLWDFVHGRVATSRLPAFVAEHHEILRRALPSETLEWMGTLDGGASEAGQVRANLGKAISAFEMDCACPRFPASSTTQASQIPLPLLVDSAFAFVEHHIETSLTLIAKDAWYARFWTAQPDTEVHLQAGHYYCCRHCNTSFLMVLDESRMEYMILALSARELAESTPQKLRDRFASDFSLVPVGDSATS